MPRRVACMDCRSRKPAASLPQERPSRKSSRSRGPNLPQYTPASSSDSPSEAESHPDVDAPESQSRFTAKPADRPRKAAKLDTQSSPSSSPAHEPNPKQHPATAGSDESDHESPEQLPHATVNGGGSDHDLSEQLQASPVSGKRPGHHAQPQKRSAKQQQHSAVKAIFGAQLRADTPCKPDLGASGADNSSRRQAGEHDQIMSSDPYSMDALDGADGSQGGGSNRKGAMLASKSSRQGSGKQAARSIKVGGARRQPDLQQQCKGQDCEASAADQSRAGASCKSKPRSSPLKHQGPARLSTGEKVAAELSSEALKPSSSDEESPLEQQHRRSPRTRATAPPQPAIENLRASTPDDPADVPSGRLQQPDASADGTGPVSRSKQRPKHAGKGRAKRGTLEELDASADGAYPEHERQPGSGHPTNGPAKSSCQPAANGHASDNEQKVVPGVKQPKEAAAKASRNPSAPKGKAGKAGSKTKPAAAKPTLATRKRKAGA